MGGPCKYLRAGFQKVFACCSKNFILNLVMYGESLNVSDIIRSRF